MVLPIVLIVMLEFKFSVDGDRRGSCSMLAVEVVFDIVVTLFMMRISSLATLFDDV